MTLGEFREKTSYMPDSATITVNWEFIEDLETVTVDVDENDNTVMIFARSED